MFRDGAKGSSSPCEPSSAWRAHAFAWSAPYTALSSSLRLVRVSRRLPWREVDNGPSFGGDLSTYYLSLPAALALGRLIGVIRKPPARSFRRSGERPQTHDAVFANEDGGFILPPDSPGLSLPVPVSDPNSKSEPAPLAVHLMILRSSCLHGRSLPKC